MKIENLTIEEKIGQMLMVGISSKKDIPKVLEMIKTLHIGGVLLYKKNYDNYKEMILLIKQLHNANKNNKIPLFIAIDQEGGIVNRMPNEFLNLYNIKKIASTKDEKIIKDAGKITGQLLKQTGINLNLAPVLDLDNEKNKGLTKRCFSKDPEVVSKYSKLYIEELTKNKIISTIKHFPGHGATNVDSHIFLPKIKKYDMLKKDLEPFKCAIKNNCDSMMLSHMIIKDIDRFYPCTMSKKIIKEKIRKELKYDGLIITDEMRMKAVRYLYGKNRAIIKAFQAGNDIVLFKYRKKDINRVKKLKKYMKDEKELNEHVERIINIKEKYNFFKNREIEKCNIEEINLEIKRINLLVEKKHK